MKISLSNAIGKIWLADLDQQIVIWNAATGAWPLLDILRIATPCNELSHFASNSQQQRLSASELKSTLQFLNDGRRGFLLALIKGQESTKILAGDRVFAIHKKTKWKNLNPRSGDPLNEVFGSARILSNPLFE